MADRVTVIGWDGTPPSPAARAALDAATLVAGAPRHLDLTEVPEAAERVPLGSVDRAVERIAAHRGSAVVFSDGDPGFFGVLRALRDPRHGLEVEVIPAVSAVSLAFARAGMPWEDARVVTANRRTLRRAVNVCRAHPKVAVLTSPGAGPAELALLLGEELRTFVICEAPGTEGERITVLTSDRVARHRWTDPNVTIVVGAPGALSGPPDTPGGSGVPGGAGAPGEGVWLAGREAGAGALPRGWGLPPAVYGESPARTAPGDGSSGEPADDPHLRAAQLAALGPGPGDLVWDVGGGSGWTALEAARQGAGVIVVDRDARTCARISATARRLGVPLRVVHGAAPQALADLPEPDVVRIGGGGPRTLLACVDRRPQRVVGHALTRDGAEAAGRVLSGAGYGVRCALLQTVELETSSWTEQGRNVAFLLVGSRM
ncbi:precorrin-6y C5,15-methyltransferase (decarboxylating) subunit CbiE [Streptomyces sp. ST2-7A]|uniref:precorrin-6y C5,15-methyltransferase (decarboxylating) subunit CbiE n=1 Tax=Streptomyces sp. ST2-7A TaxID=2907214 RepID=UPI001F4763CD|nr:precorrin-6y C5,15-methyltransferase (decarboxylating) subunit CbiE [Streptomyces sp. ST2-7A]MCE7079747.1 precorrin-6y C5,15-methyltransferase (decarboxylating) subunit CbiE [Streptomyces sp. ST2-7A]